MRTLLCLVLLNSTLAAPLSGAEFEPRHHVSKRQLGEVALQLSHVLGFLVTVGSQTLQQVGRMGQDIVGNNNGGLLALLESVFVGIERSSSFDLQDNLVSSDIVRNFLSSLVSTVDTVLGTPTEEESLVRANGGKKKTEPQSRPRGEPKKGAERQKQPPTNEEQLEASLGKRISADLREINAARKRFWASIQHARTKVPA